MNRLPPPQNGNRFVGWVRRLVRRWLLQRDEKRAFDGCLTCQHWQRQDDERDRLHLTFNVGICKRVNIASKSYDRCDHHSPNEERIHGGAGQPKT